MKIFCSYSKLVPIAEIKEHPKNPNRHSKEQIEMLAKIIKGAGWRVPIGVSKLSGYIVRGHGRYLAALACGMTEVPVDFQDYETVEHEIADMLADNRIAELSDLDYQQVSNCVKEISNGQLELTGYRDFEIQPLLQANWTPPPLCEVPPFIIHERFAATKEQAETIRKGIKWCQSRSKEDLTDGQCLEIIVTEYLKQEIENERLANPKTISF